MIAKMYRDHLTASGDISTSYNLFQVLFMLRIEYPANLSSFRINFNCTKMSKNNLVKLPKTS